MKCFYQHWASRNAEHTTVKQQHRNENCVYFGHDTTTPLPSCCRTAWSLPPRHLCSRSPLSGSDANAPSPSPDAAWPDRRTQKRRKLHFGRGSKQHFQRWFFNPTPMDYSETLLCLQQSLVVALLLINSDICSCWKMRERGWGDLFCFLFLRPLLHLRLRLVTGLNVQKANKRHIVTSHFISGSRKCRRCGHQPAGSGKHK